MSRRKLRHLLAAAAVLFPWVAARADTIKVNSGVASDLQEAIDAAAAGDTISVSGGPYVGNFVVPAGKDGLVIKGKATIDAYLGPRGLVVNSSGVTISGLTIRQAGSAGLRAPFGGPAKLTSIILTHCSFVNVEGFGIDVVSDDAVITSCTLTGCDSGLHVTGDQAAITSCSVANDGTNGIRVDGDNCRVLKCTCTMIEDGSGVIVLGDNGKVEKCHVSDCDSAGVSMSGTGSAALGNVVANIMDAGITVSGAAAVIQGNSVVATDGDGIDVAGADALVEDNKISHVPDDSLGLSISSVTGGHAEGNVIDSVSEIGLEFVGSSGVISKNKVSRSGSENEEGVLVSGNDNTIEKNTVSDCDNSGIVVIGSTNDLVGNKLSDCTSNGIVISGLSSAENVLDGNSCTSNDGQGLLNGGVGTLLRHNTFKKNLLDVANETAAGATIVDDGNNSFTTGGFTTEPLVP